MNKLVLFLSVYILSLNGNAQDKSEGILLPSQFIEGARFYVKIATSKGDTLLGFADTGGGFTALFPDVAEKNGLSKDLKSLTIGDQDVQYILFDDLVADKRIPPIETASFIPVKESLFLVPSKKILGEQGVVLLKSIPQDIFLGQHFFMGKAWTFDYLNQKIWVNTPINKNEAKNENIQSIGFKKDESGNKLFGHPSMKVVIDGDTLDMLFDTGASFILSDTGKMQMNTSNASIAGSFIAKSVYNKWVSNHPTWKVYKNADNFTNIIEVPSVTIGSYSVGPVLFSVRPDEAWSKNMITSMDKVVKGAVGGSALKYFKVKIDYNNELIQFMK
ncbi:MAG: hypothetical protein ABIP35_13145 [Ginsengibacter sp.]